MTNESVIFRRRKALELTQREAAERARLDRSTFNQMENGKKTIGPVVAARLAEALGGETNDYVTGPAVRPVALAEELLKRLAAGEHVPRENLERIAQLLEETAALNLRLADRLRGAGEVASSA